MKFYILPGNSLHNQGRAMTLARMLGQESKVQQYQHWTTTAPIIDLAAEGELFVEQTENYEDYTLICKSAGSLIALEQLPEMEYLPSKVYIWGLPLRFAESMDVDIVELRDELPPVDILIYQHTYDPEGYYEEVCSWLGDDACVELPGDSHDYAIDTIIDIVK